MMVPSSRDQAYARMSTKEGMSLRWREGDHHAHTRKKSTNPSLSSRTDLIQPFLPTNDQRPLNSQFPQGLREHHSQATRVDADDHPLGPGRIDQGSEDIEDCAERQRFTDGSKCGHGWMVEGGEEECEGGTWGEDLGEGEEEVG